MIFFERSPFATAIVTSAKLRTCAVRLPAIWLTDSVNSFQTPDTPFTCACPPSLPSVPTSRATRITSTEKAPSWPTMPFTSLAVRRYSPRNGRPPSSKGIVWVRSPFATAPITRPISTVGWESSSTSALMASIRSAQFPTESPMCSRSRMRPSSPTCRRSRRRLLLNRSRRAAIALIRSLTFPSTPVRVAGRRTEKSPSLIPSSAPTNCSRNASAAGEAAEAAEARWPLRRVDLEGGGTLECMGTKVAGKARKNQKPQRPSRPAIRKRQAQPGSPRAGPR